MIGWVKRYLAHVQEYLEHSEKYERR